MFVLVLPLFVFTIFVYANLLLLPIKRLLTQSKNSRHVSKLTISITDLFALAALTQYPLLVAVSSGMAIRRGEMSWAVSIAVLSILLGAVVWWAGIRVLNQIEVRKTSPRVVFLLAVLPFSVVGGISAMPLFINYVASIFDDTMNPLIEFGLLATFAIFSFVAYRAAMWVSRQSELKYDC